MKIKLRPAKGAERLVVVDDEAAVARMMVTLLGRHGYRVVAFTNSVKALEAYRADPTSVDLVIADLAMPQLDGLELARGLTAVRQVPILIASGNVLERAPGELANLGVRAVLRKPVAMADLTAAIRKALDG